MVFFFGGGGDVEENGSNVLENRVVRTCGCKRDDVTTRGKLNGEGPHDELFSAYYYNDHLMRIKWVGHVPRMRQEMYTNFGSKA
jgi:hypothetical protein